MIPVYRLQSYESSLHGSAASLLAVSPAAAAMDQEAYSFTVYMDEYGNEIGYLVTYCDG